MVDPSFGLGKLIYIMLHQNVFSIVMPNYSGEYALSSFTTIGHLHHFCLLPIIYMKNLYIYRSSQCWNHFSEFWPKIARHALRHHSQHISCHINHLFPPSNALFSGRFSGGWSGCAARGCHGRLPAVGSKQSLGGEFIEIIRLVVWNMAAIWLSIQLGIIILTLIFFRGVGIPPTR